MTLGVFDEDEETFFENIPYPEALSRSVLHVGETWKLAANVQYLRDIMKQAEVERTEAVQNAHDEHDDDTRHGEEQGRGDCIAEIYNSLTNFIANESKLEDLVHEIELYFKDLQ